jgi:hypothetical protein
MPNPFFKIFFKINPFFACKQAKIGSETVHFTRKGLNVVETSSKSMEKPRKNNLKLSPECQKKRLALYFEVVSVLLTV